MTICYDLRFPHLFRDLALNGADLITVPSVFMHITGKDHWHSLLKARAIETGCYIVAPAQYGHYFNKLEHELAFLKNNWPSNLPKAIIHADLFQDNIFFIQEKFSGVIDFYFSCEDFFAFEIAICFNALCFDGLKSNLSFNVTKAKNFIDGYTSVRKLSHEELNNIKVLSQGAALRFLLTRVFDALNKVEGAIVKIKDPMEYLKRLEFHKNAKNHEDYFF